MIKIAAFPKCWIEDISEGRMDLFEWIELSAQLECDGLEMYSRFLRSHESGYLSEVRDRVKSLGMEIPMMCYSRRGGHFISGFTGVPTAKQKCWLKCKRRKANEYL